MVVVLGTSGAYQRNPHTTLPEMHATRPWLAHKCSDLDAAGKEGVGKVQSQLYHGENKPEMQHARAPRVCKCNLHDESKTLRMAHEWFCNEAKAHQFGEEQIASGAQQSRMNPKQKERMRRANM